jgi:PIN domain
MIVVLDTNVFRSDVYAERSQLRAVIERAVSGAYSVVVPRVCVEELVRQFPQRLAELRRDVKTATGTMQTFGLRPPELPDTDAAIASYRDRLEQRLSDDGCEIADYPDDAYLAVQWTAQRRKPIKHGGNEDGRGAPDAAVWLTVLARAGQEQVVLVTANSSDFADPADSAALHPVLLEDLQSRGIGTRRVELLPSLFAFITRYVKPAQGAKAAAEALLADEGVAETLRAEISDAAQWYQLQYEQFTAWSLGADIDDAHISDVEVGEIELVAVEVGNEGLDLALRAHCTARVDLMIWKYDAYALEDGDPIRIYDFDWNESMAAAEVERQGVLELQCDYREAEGKFDVEILEIEL